MVKQQQRHEAGPAKVQATAVKTRSRKCRRPQRRLSRAQVLKMQPRKQSKPDTGTQSSVPGSSGAVSPGVPNGETSKEFLSTGRTGRRNALPDILGHHADTDTADLPSRLEALTTETNRSQYQQRRSLHIEAAHWVTALFHLAHEEVAICRVMLCGRCQGFVEKMLLFFNEAPAEWKLIKFDGLQKSGLCLLPKLIRAGDWMRRDIPVMRFVNSFKEFGI